MFIPVEVWLRAFALTVLVEVPVGAPLLRRWEASWPRLLTLIVLANLASHPAVWFVFTQLFDIGTPGYTLAAEGWAVACEALFYWAAFRGIPLRRAIAVSLLANAASFLVGQLVFTLWPELSL